MKDILKLLICFIILSISAYGATYTVTATSLTMHMGDPVPPLIFSISTYTAPYSGVFNNRPTITTTATSGSSAGTYPITIVAGSMTPVSGGDSLSFVNGMMTVIPADSSGAQITNSISYPSGIYSGPSFAAINVTSNPTCNMVADGTTDNTTCLQNLLTAGGLRTSNTSTAYYHQPLTLHFPCSANPYLISGSLTTYGNSWTLEGEGPTCSTIKVAPNSAAFNTGTSTPVLNYTSISGSNNNFLTSIINMGVDLGYGNPNAYLVRWAGNNAGSYLSNVMLWSEDSLCPYGVAMNENYPGPTLLKNVAVYGCGVGIFANQNEYNWVGDQITTEGQTSDGIQNSSGMNIAIQHWLHVGPVQAFTGNGACGAIIDSEILSGSGTGITNASNSCLFVRSLTASGYSPTYTDSGTGTPVNYTGNVIQAWTGTAQSLFNQQSTPSSLFLPEQETPVPGDPAASGWIQLGSDPTTWGTSLASCSSTTAYAPPGVYPFGGTVNIPVPTCINHIQLYGLQPTPTSSQITFTVSGTSATPLVIDRCSLYCAIVQGSSRTVVLTHGAFNTYVAASGAGSLFLEDATVEVAPTYVAGQSVWARDYDAETNPDVGQQFTCVGCVLWVLGLKTENTIPSGLLTTHAQAEIFGGFLYPVLATTTPIAFFNLANSPFFGTWETASFGANENFQYQVSETQGPTTLNLPSPSKTAGTQMNMFYSLGITNYGTIQFNGNTVINNIHIP